jgi:hypothetical protein
LEKLGTTWKNRKTSSFPLKSARKTKNGILNLKNTNRSGLTVFGRVSFSALSEKYVENGTVNLARKSIFDVNKIYVIEICNNV